MVPRGACESGCVVVDTNDQRARSIGQDGIQEAPEQGRILASAELPGTVHGQLCHPEVHGPQAGPGSGGRADGRTAGHVGTTHEGLQRHPGPFGQVPYLGGPRRISGVPLPGVELQGRASIE